MFLLRFCGIEWFELFGFSGSCGLLALRTLNSPRSCMFPLQNLTKCQQHDCMMMFQYSLWGFCGVEWFEVFWCEVLRFWWFEEYYALKNIGTLWDLSRIDDLAGYCWCQCFQYKITHRKRKFISSTYFRSRSKRQFEHVKRISLTLLI